jgi:molybdopterin-guanine dinucleotide biosynthesis protein A
MTRIAGAILAGGLGRRLGGNKPLHPFLGRPLIEHVIERTERQVESLWLSVNDIWDQLVPLRLPMVRDAPGYGNSGPLAGIVATLAMAELSGFDQVAVFPCDAPFIPLDLVERLRRSLDGAGAPGIVVETSRGLQPTFGLWSVNAIGSARAALEAGRLRLSSLCGELGMAVLDCRAWESGEDLFVNINTTTDLERAGGMRPADDWPRLNRAALGRER